MNAVPPSHKRCACVNAPGVLINGADILHVRADGAYCICPDYSRVERLLRTRHTRERIRLWASSLSRKINAGGSACGLHQAKRTAVFVTYRVGAGMATCALSARLRRGTLNIKTWARRLPTGVISCR